MAVERILGEKKMIKVKLFKDYYENKMEDKINDFIRENLAAVKDIKFNTTKDEHGNIIYNALVMYKEGE